MRPKGGSVNGGFQQVARVWSGEQIPHPIFTSSYLNFASVLPQFYLFLTFLKPHFNLCSASNLEPRFGNHGLQTLGQYCLESHAELWLFHSETPLGTEHVFWGVWGDLQPSEA